MNHINVKVYKERAKQYDDLLTCVLCGNKFSSFNDYNLHNESIHLEKLTAAAWAKRLSKKLFESDDFTDTDIAKILAIAKKVGKNL